MDFGSRYAVARVLLPKLGPWIAASFFISVALIGNDMVVTNLFQVPTLTESLYQQVQFNEIRIWSVLASCSFVFVLGIVVWSIASKNFAFLSAERSGGDQPAYSDAFAIQGYWRWFGAFVGSGGGEPRSIVRVPSRIGADLPQPRQNTKNIF